MSKKKNVSIETALAGFKREKRGNTVSYVNEDKKIRLSRRQAENVRDGKKSLQEATLTSFRGKEKSFPYHHRTGTLYSFKSFFDLHDAVNSGAFDGNRMMILNVQGKAKVLYPDDDPKKLYQWRAPVGLSAHHTYSETAYWEQAIDHIGDMFQGDPVTFEVIFLDPK